MYLAMRKNGQGSNTFLEFTEFFIDTKNTKSSQDH